MSRKKVITILVAVGILVVLIAVFRSCRGGHRPPVERDALEGTSYRVEDFGRQATPLAILGALDSFSATGKPAAAPSSPGFL